MSKLKALIVAIDDYGCPNNNLNSCRNDAAAIEALLRHQYGFDDITLLLDADATVENVDRALAALLSDVMPADRRVFFYSGHGYQIGNGSQRDEALALRDGLYEDNRLIRHAKRVPAGTLTVILDSCFSGGLDK